MKLIRLMSNNRLIMRNKRNRPIIMFKKKSMALIRQSGKALNESKEALMRLDKIPKKKRKNRLSRIRLLCNCNLK
jgi:hypothetical protein